MENTKSENYYFHRGHQELTQSNRRINERKRRSVQNYPGKGPQAKFFKVKEEQNLWDMYITVYNESFR